MPARSACYLVLGWGILNTTGRASWWIHEHAYLTGLPRPAVGVVVIILYVAVIALMLAVTRFYRLWVFWRLPREQQGWTLIGDFLVVYIVVTFAFSSIIASMMEYGDWVRFSTAEGPITLQRFDEFDLWTYYVWSFLDAIPILKIPETLNWAVPIKFTDHVSGAFLLLYRVVMILPLVGFVTGVVHVLFTPKTSKAPDVAAPL